MNDNESNINTNIEIDIKENNRYETLVEEDKMEKKFDQTANLANETINNEDYDQDNERIIHCNCDDGSFSFISKEAEIKNINDEFKYFNNKK